MSDKTLFVTTNMRPLPESLRGMDCSCCKKPRALWALYSEDELEPWCGQCFLYESEWAAECKWKLRAFLSAVAERRGAPFVLENDRLSPADADGVLGSLLMSTRVFNLRGKLIR